MPKRRNDKMHLGYLEINLCPAVGIINNILGYICVEQEYVVVLYITLLAFISHKLRTNDKTLLQRDEYLYFIF